jgi:tetratricopeptide (TPR) repeat protein
MPAGNRNVARARILNHCGRDMGPKHLNALDAANRRTCRAWQFWIPLTLFLLSFGTTLGTVPPGPGPDSPPPPSTPRELFNAGTQKLHDGKLREAEAFLESSLSTQAENVQPSALYNLGHVRFGQGVEELKKGPAGRQASARGRAAAQRAEEATRIAEDALAGNDVQKMVEAYLNGRGARRELRAATKAVQRAMETHGAALGKWQRASGDFKSTVELNRNDADAQQNAETVDRNIARLVDSIHELQQAASAMGQKNPQLCEKLGQLKGRIPAPNMPPGAADDEEEDEDKPNGLRPGEQEGPTKEGQEMRLSREEAGWLLEGYKLDNERRLPMTQTETGDPKSRNRLPW